MGIKLLRHPIPYEEEILYSYLCRLAEANRCPLDWLIEKFNLELQHKKRTINVKLSNAILENIALAANQDIKTIQQMVLDRYDHNIKHINKFGWTDYHSNHFKAVYSKYCPLCMKEQSYQRTFWHLDNVNICTKHEAILLDSCIKCNRKLTYRHVAANKCMCGATLSEAQAITFSHPLVLRNQKRVFNVYHERPFECNVKSKFFIGMDGREYLAFVMFLKDLIMPNIKLINQYFDNQIIDALSDEIKFMLYSEYLFEDWDKRYRRLLKGLFPYVVFKSNIETKFRTKTIDKLIWRTQTFFNKKSDFIRDFYLNF